MWTTSRMRYGSLASDAEDGTAKTPRTQREDRRTPWIVFMISLLVSSIERPQVVEEAGVGLGDAAGVVDDHAGHAQPDQGQAHGHAVVVVRLHPGALERPGVD